MSVSPSGSLTAKGKLTAKGNHGAVLSGQRLLEVRNQHCIVCERLLAGQVGSVFVDAVCAWSHSERRVRVQEPRHQNQ
jgi:hypothetical protein